MEASPAHPGGDVATVRVTYRGDVVVATLARDATVRDLGAELERATGASLATQKLLGVKSGPRATAGVLVPSREADGALLVAAVAGLCDAAKPLMLMATPREEIQRLHDAEGVDHRVRGFDDEAKRHRRRQRSHRSRSGASAASASGPPSAALHPYTFGAYRALPIPPVLLASGAPPASAALSLLHRLASDPGVLGVMRAHKWKVGLLAEMPPEGKVGVSESCVLGYNVNMGAEIDLRLRTDDLRGFRRYGRVRETLLHELTHNVHGEHDAKFKALCSRLNVECARFDWKRSIGNGAARLGGGGGESIGGFASDGEESWSEDEAMAATRASSGNALGGGEGGGGGGETAFHTTPFAWCTSFLKDFSRRHSSPALPFQRLTGKTFD